MSAKEKLLLWTQKVTAGYVGLKCTNFSSCWSDGKMFNAIIHRYRPDLVDMERVQIQSGRENLEQAFEIAERLGVTRLLDAEDVDVPSPDEKSVITYVSSIYDAFPKVPEGGEGISATEVDTRWLEYQNQVESLVSWIKQHTIMMSDKSFPQNPVELKALYNQYIHFKETEIPAKQQEKRGIEELYKLLETWIEFGRIKLSQGYHPNDVEEAWGKLIIEMLEREKLLRPAVERLELLLQIANKIQNGTLSCEEKLTLARNTLQADEAHLESGQLVQYESNVVMYLQECEGLIRQLQADVQILRDENYYQLEELVFKIVRLQDELVTLRLECTNLYRKGHFSSPSSRDLLQPSSLNTTHLKAEPLLKGTHTATTTSTSWFRKPMTRTELVAISSSEDEGSLRFVYELLSWVEEMQMKLERAEWGSDLPSVESQLEVQRHIHTSVEDLGASVKEARLYENKMSQNFRTSYSETLAKLETQYCKLMETSTFRLRHLQSLYAFVSQATTELIWLNEKEEEELAYDWSDNNPNMAAKRNYFSELTMELEEKQDVFRSLQDTAEMLSLENHPAKQTVEAYSAAVQTQWQWIKQLCLCVDQHVTENTAYFQFFSDARDSEGYLKSLQDTIKRKYSCDRNTSLTRLEDLLQDSMPQIDKPVLGEVEMSEGKDEKEQLIQSKSSVASLVGRSKSIVQLKPRNPDHVLKNTISVKAICDYRQIEITICKNDECVLEDNSQRTKWKVISPTGNEAMVPSVCFLIPPPNKEAIDFASRVEQLYQKVMALWHQLHINMKSLVSWNYLRKVISLVQSWNVEKLRALPPGECHQTMRNLQVHYTDFLEDSRDSELFSVTDRLRLEEEVEACKERFQQLLQSMENEDKDETAARTYLSELKNIRIHLEECEQRLVGTIRTPSSTRTDGDALQENTFRVAEQERLKEDLHHLKADVEQLSERCNIFLHKSPTGSSAPHLRSELNLLVEKMNHVYGLSSVYLDKLKTVDVIIQNTQGAESLVKGYEVKLSQEEAVPVDLATIRSHRAALQQWISEMNEKNTVFAMLEDDLARAKVVADRLFSLKQERSPDVERYQEKGAQLWDRWQRASTQLETRQLELESIEEVLSTYRSCHGALIQWIEETTAQQERMKPGQAEDSRVLSEQLSQQMALFAEIEGNQAKLDQCQKLSQQYSAAVKDYELQLMTYRAFVESQQKSPVKRRRVLSSSDAITQEFMDLRTRYTALVTLTTQHVKYISDALRRLEEEEKVVEEEKQEHVDKVKELLGWITSFKQCAQFKSITPNSKELGDIEKSILEQQACIGKAGDISLYTFVLSEELAAKKEEISEAVKTTQIFLAKHGHKLSGQEKEQIVTQLNALKETYDQLCSDSTEQLQQLHSHMAQETAHKGIEIISGVLDLGTMEVLPVFGAMQKGLIDQETGLNLLEAQVITAGLMVPDTNEKLSLAEGLARGIIDCRTHQLLWELQEVLQLVNQTDLKEKPLLPLVALMEDGAISESLGLKISEVQLVTGGFIDSFSHGRIGLEEALQRGLVTTSFHGKLTSHLRSCKDLIDPNSAKKTSLNDLMRQCTLHQETGLRLLPVKQLAGGMVNLKSGSKVSIFRAVQEGLLEKQVMLRLLEAQLFAGGIVDPKSGHRLTVDEAIRHNLIDQDLACALLVRQLQTGGIIDTVTGERLLLDDAVRKGLVASRIAVVILESLWSFMGLLWPESGEILPVLDALEQGILSTELAHKILSMRRCIKALYIHETREILSWKKAVDRGILDRDTAKKLKSVCLPDIMPKLSLADSPARNKRSIFSSGGQTDHQDQSELPLRTNEENMLSYLITHSYINVHNGQKLLLIDRELRDFSEMHAPAHNNGSDTHLFEASKTHPPKLDIHEEDKSVIFGANVCDELASKVLEPSLDIPEKESNVSVPHEKAEMEDAGESVIVKNQERKADATEKSEIDESNFYLPDEKAEVKDAGENVTVKNHREADAAENFKSEMNESNICLPNEKAEMEDAGENGNAKNRETEADATEKSEINDSKREQDLMMLQNNHEMELSGNTCMKDFAFETQLRDVEIGKGDPMLAEPSVRENMIFRAQTEIPEIKNSGAKDTGMFTDVLEKVEELQYLKDRTLNKVGLAVKDGEPEAVHFLNTVKTENGSPEAVFDEVEGKRTEQHIKEQLLGIREELVHFHKIETPESPELSPGMGRDSTLKMLLTQLQNGGIIDEQTGRKMLLDESIACGVVPSHTAVKLMGAMQMFGGFFDAQTCESLTTEEVIGEGLMDEELLQKVLASDQAISGVIDPLTKTLYSVKDASEVGLLDQETAVRILEGQMVTGGIVDFKRGKKISVTLASNLGLIQPSSQEDLKKLEKVSKGKGAEDATQEKLIALQVEICGILDPQTKKPLTITQAVEKRLLGKEKAFKLLTKQIADGGILHHKTGMRLSLEDAMQHGLIGQDFYEELKKAESVCLHQYTHPETKKQVSSSEAISLGLISPDFQSKVQEIQASTGSIFDPVSCQKITLTEAVREGLLPKPIMEKAVSSEMKHAIIHPDSCRLVPYSQLVRKSKIDIESGQRYLEVVPFQELKDEATGNIIPCAQAVKLGKVDPMLALRLLQAQADTGGIMDVSSGQRLSLASALEQEMVDEDMAAAIAVNQLLTGGIVDAESGGRVALKVAVEKGIISKKLGSTVQEVVQITRDKSDHKDLDEHDRYALLVQNGALKMEALPVCNDDVAKSNNEKQGVEAEAIGTNEDVLNDYLKGIQEVSKETDETVSVPVPLTSTLDSLGGSELAQELSSMLDPEAMRIRTQKKNIGRKRRLRGKESQKGEIERQARGDRVIEKQLERIVSFEKSVMSGMRNVTINGDQEQREGTFVGDSGDQTEGDTAALVANGGVLLESLEMLGSTELGSVGHRGEGEACVNAKELATAAKPEKQTSAKVPLADTKTQHLSQGSEVLGTPIPSVIDLKTTKKKMKKDKKQGSVPREPMKLCEFSEEKQSFHVPDSKGIFMRMTKDSLSSETQKSIEENSSGHGARNLTTQRQPAAYEKDDNQAPESEKKQLEEKEDTADAQKVSIPPKKGTPRELTEQTARTDHESLVVAVNIPEERASWEKDKEPLIPEGNQIPSIIAVGDTESPKAKTQTLQEHTTHEISRADGSCGVQEPSMAAGAEETWQMSPDGGQLSELMAGTLQEGELPRGEMDASKKLAVQENADLEMTRESESVGGLPSTAGGVEERGQDTSKQPFKPAKALCRKQLCLDLDEKLVAFLSRVRSIEMQIQQAQLAERNLEAQKELLHQAVALDTELKSLSAPVNQVLEEVKGIVSNPPFEIPQQLLRALEKDAKNLQKFFGSVSEISASWLLNLRTAAEAEKAKVLMWCEELQSKLQELLNWVSDTTHSLSHLESHIATSTDSLNSCLQSYKELQKPLVDTKAQLDAAAFDIQFFISEHAQDLTPEQSRQLLRLLNELQGSFRDLTERVAARVEVLQVCLHQAEQTDQTLQEQQAIRSQKLEELCTWMSQAETCLRGPQEAAAEGDLPMLQRRQSDVKDLQRSMHSRAASFASVLKVTEEFLEENRTKLDPGELASLKDRLQEAKERYQSLQERTEVAQQELEDAVKTVVQQQTEKDRAAKDLEENQSKIDSLLHWMASLEQPRTLTEHKLHSVRQANGGHREERVPDVLDGQWMKAGRAEEDLSLHYENLKVQHQQLLSQQRDVILATQSAHAFLDKQGHALRPEERQKLQERLEELRAQYTTALSQSEMQLKQAQALQDELQKFLRDTGEFKTWLGQAEQELERMRGGDGSLGGLQSTLLWQSGFSEDVISHKGDLRFVTMSGQKVLDVEKMAAAVGRPPGPEVLATGMLVKDKLDDATKRYGTLHAKCTTLGSHLNMLLDRSKQFQDVSESLRTWLRESEEAVSNLLSEPISSDPAVLQKQLANAKSLQEDLAEHQVPMKQLEKATRSLWEIREAPMPDHRVIQETTDSIVSRFQSLSCRMAERSDLLQKSIAQSQSVQEGLETLLQSMGEIERSLQRSDVASFSSSSIQESLATNMKLKQDIARQRSSLEAMQEMVAQFAATSDSSTAAALQAKLVEVTKRFDSLRRRQQEKEDVLKDLLPKVEQYEQLSEKLQQFMESRSRLLASGNQPDHDIAHFSQQIQELNSEMMQHQENLEKLERVSAELSSCGFAVAASPQHQEKVRSLRKEFLQLQKVAKEREKGASSCQEQLDEFRKLVGSIRKWLKETERNLPTTETSLGTHELEKRQQQVEFLLDEWTENGALVRDINCRGTALESLIVEITAPDAQSKT
ncbi:UNVERIFIED_CONTAM: hypothetical protein K2H54_044031, partial [Gekko kuhli]